MNDSKLSKPTLGRLPAYLKYLESISETVPTISATSIARALQLGDAQVRKDLAAVSGEGKPKTGYQTLQLIEKLKKRMGLVAPRKAVVIGAGHLGRALLDYDGFSEYGLSIAAAFDTVSAKVQSSERLRPILPMDELTTFCRCHHIHLGIITVPEDAAQAACDRLVQNHITAIWSFAPVALAVPEGVTLREENLALSLAYLNQSIA